MVKLEFIYIVLIIASMFNKKTKKLELNYKALNLYD